MPKTTTTTEVKHNAWQEAQGGEQPLGREGARITKSKWRAVRLNEFIYETGMQHTPWGKAANIMEVNKNSRTQC
jgi:hypothetical protein